MNEKAKYDLRLIVPFVYIGIVLCLLGCGGAPTKPTPKPVGKTTLPSIRYTVQAGAFSNMGNAVRFTEKLRQQGVNAYHFLHRSGLYKVRFGNFSSRTAARKKAAAYLSAGVIDDFYIVAPEKYNKTDLRDRIIRTADSFIGVPYRWGGESVDEGFDCSGFTMTVYRLNGLELPRSSRAQWQAGVRVDKNRLNKGDLLFFHTSGSGKITHVGIYAGSGKFIHAPGKGKNVRTTSLGNPYFKKRYSGAKTYF